MKSPIPLIALCVAFLLFGCGSATNNTAGNTTTNATSSSSNTSAPSNTGNTANTANAANSSNASSGESSGPSPTDQIDPAAKIENGKTMTLKQDITITIPADWKKGPNQNVDEFIGKTQDGKQLTLIVYWSPADDKYKGLSTPQAAIEYLKQMRPLAEDNPDKYTLPRVLKLMDNQVGVAYDTKSSTPDGVNDWSWTTWDSADFEKGFTFRYPTGAFDQYKSVRDGIINSVKFKRGPRTPTM